MTTREIDYQYLESLPTLLEIKGLDSERTRLYQNFVVKNLLQPSFVTRVYITGSENGVKLTLLLPLRLAIQIERYSGSKRILQVSEVSPCCLTDVQYSAVCLTCKTPLKFRGTRLSPLNIQPELTLVPLSEREENVSYDGGEDAFLVEVAQILQDRDIDAFNALLIASELWHLTYALGLLKY